MFTFFNLTSILYVYVLYKEYSVMILRQLSAVAILALASTVSFAADEFFEVGKTYLFVPRLNMVMVGTVSQVTDHEIVFTNRSLLKASKAASTVMNDDAKSGKIKANAIADYLKSDKTKRAAMVESGPLTDVPTSYSRAEMTAMKVDE